MLSNLHRLPISHLGISHLRNLTFLLGMYFKLFLKNLICLNLHKMRSQIYFLFGFCLLWIRDRRRRHKVHLTFVLSELKWLVLFLWFTFFRIRVLDFITLTLIFIARWWKKHPFRRLIIIFILFLSLRQLI